MIEIRQKLSVSVIIPAHNEADNIKTVISATKKVREVDEILVVNDGSTDDTVNVAKKCGAKVISIIENKGKGHAMKIGGARSKGDVLVFLDADLKNITPEKIRKIIDPFRDLYDFVKTRFDRRAGRVTELTAKPLLGHFFPKIEKNFSQPLSGQIGIRKELFKKLTLEDDYGWMLGC